MKIIRKKPEDNFSAYRPERRLISLRDVMNRIFDESFWDPFVASGFNLLPSRWSGFPKVDIAETDKEIKVVADVPGVDPEKLEIEVSDDALSLSGRLESEKEEKDKKFYRFEREYGEFRREFLLPAKVNPDKVSAKIKNGVLTVVLPKAEVKKTKKVKAKAE